jgi:Protein of unknown function (DUF1559)
VAKSPGSSIFIQVLRGFAYSVIVVGVGATLLWAFWMVPRRDSARRSSCASNLKQLSVAVLSYTQDYDEHFPLKPRPGNDWMVSNREAVRWARPVPGGRWFDVPPEGPLMDYAKNWQLIVCPSDPQYRQGTAWRLHLSSSYLWNDNLCGKLVTECQGQPLVWDREPWHQNGRNVAYVGQNVHWLPEADFQQLFAVRHL